MLPTHHAWSAALLLNTTTFLLNSSMAVLATILVSTSAQSKATALYCAYQSHQNFDFVLNWRLVRY